MLRVVMLAVCVLFGSFSAAHAEEPPRPMPRATQAKLLGYGALAGGGALALSIGMGFFSWAAGDEPRHSDDIDSAAITGMGVALAMSLVTVPLATGITVRVLGKREGYRGGGAASYFGALLGLGIGAGATLAGIFGSGRFESLRLGPTIAVGSVIGLVSVGGFSMLGYRASDRVRTRLLPSASTTSLGLAAHGTF